MSSVAARIGRLAKSHAKGFLAALKGPSARQEAEKAIQTVAKKEGIKGKTNVLGYAHPLESYYVPGKVSVKPVRNPGPGKKTYSLRSKFDPDKPGELVVGAGAGKAEDVVPIGLHELGHAYGHQKKTLLSKVRKASTVPSFVGGVVGQYTTVKGTFSGNLPVAAAGAALTAAAAAPVLAEEAGASLWALSRRGKAEKALGKKLNFSKMTKAQLSYPRGAAEDIAVPAALGTAWSAGPEAGIPVTAGVIAYRKARQRAMNKALSPEAKDLSKAYQKAIGDINREMPIGVKRR